MASFNRINGEFACDNHTLQTALLRDVFGFRGWIMSDYSANHSTAESANAGLDQEQPSEGFWGSKLLAAVQNGEVAEATIDEKVRRILRPLIGMGQLENPPVIAELPVDEHHATAQRIAESAMVLLRNDGVLPLAGVRKLALIGTDVDTAGAQGGGSSLVRGTKYVSPLEGLQRALGDDVEISVAYGSEPVTPGALLPGNAEAVPEAFFRTPEGERGLRAEFWTNTNHEGDPFVSRADGVIEHNWGFHNFPGFNAGSPRYPLWPGEVNGQSSARWTGTLTVPVTGVYGFSVTALGRFSFELDDELIASSEVTPQVGKTAQTEPAEVVLLASDEVVEAEPEPEGERPMPLGASGFGGSTGPTRQYEASVRLIADRSYKIRFDYIADDPSQQWLLGTRVRLGWTPPAGVVSPDVTAAAELAASADAAVVVVRTYEARRRTGRT